MLDMEASSSKKLLENAEIMVLDSSSNLREDVGLEELTDYLSGKDALVWCDISATDKKGGPYWRLMRETFGFDQLTIEDCFSHSRLPLLNDYGSYLFMVLFSFHLPEGKEKTRVCQTEVDLYLGENYVVCVHSKPVPELDRVRERLRAKDEFVSSSAPNVAYAVLDAVVDGYAPIMEALAEQVDEIEEALLGTERADESVDEREDTLFDLKNHLTALRRIVTPQKDNMAALLGPANRLVPEESRKYFQDVCLHLARIADSIETMREHLAGISEAYNMRVNRRMNQDLQRLTAISTIFLPLAFITGLYGMNFDDMPELHFHYGYFLILAVLAGLFSFLFYYFRRKRML
jgi:magnesium transporter